LNMGGSILLTIFSNRGNVDFGRSIGPNEPLQLSAKIQIV
jgi:hypothetical protein